MKTKVWTSEIYRKSIKKMIRDLECTELPNEEEAMVVEKAIKHLEKAQKLLKGCVLSYW